MESGNQTNTAGETDTGQFRKCKRWRWVGGLSLAFVLALEGDSAY